MGKTGVNEDDTDTSTQSDTVPTNDDKDKKANNRTNPSLIRQKRESK